MVATGRLTLDRFLELPETSPPSEFKKGKVIQKPMPNDWHGLIQRLLSAIFSTYLDDNPNIGDAGPEIRCIFGPEDDVRVYIPDYIFVIDEAGPFTFTGGPRMHAPDLAVEVLSPDDRMTQVNDKVRFYLENGVKLVWIIDPYNRVITVMTGLLSARTLTEHDVLDGSAILPNFSVPVRRILPPVRSKN